MQTTASIALLLGVALSGCGSVDQADPEAKPSNRPTATTASLDDSLTEETPPTDKSDDGTADDGVATFGEQYNYEDGLSIKVSKPGRYKPDEYAAFRKGDKHFIQLTVTVLTTPARCSTPRQLALRRRP